MLSVRIIAVGKLKEAYLRAACDEYIKRIGAFAKISVEEIAEYKLPANPSESEINAGLCVEGNAILSKISGKAFNIAMCIEGERLSSEKFSKKINGVMLSGISTVNFIIGGSFGLSDEVKRNCDLRLSMSEMTFPHQLFRVMLLEQIYRAFQIAGNGKYHK